MTRDGDARVRVVVRGRVQRVFYRATIAEAADHLRMAGWVRNRADGTVEAEFQGPSSAIDQMIDACRKGSEQSRVEDVSVEHIDPLDGPNVFTVR